MSTGLIFFVFSQLLAQSGQEFSGAIPVEAGRTSGSARVPEFVPRFALEVLNPEVIGRNLIHLEDLIGPDAKKVGSMKPTKTVLLLLTGVDCDACEQHWDTIGRAHRAATKLGGRVIGLISGNEDQKPQIRKKLLLSKPKVIVGWDAYGLSRQRLGLLRRGSALIIRADGTVDGRFAGAKQNTKALLGAFTQALKEGG